MRALVAAHDQLRREVDGQLHARAGSPPVEERRGPQAGGVVEVLGDPARERVAGREQWLDVDRRARTDQLASPRSPRRGRGSDRGSRSPRAPRARSRGRRRGSSPSASRRARARPSFSSRGTLRKRSRLIAAMIGSTMIASATPAVKMPEPSGRRPHRISGSSRSTSCSAGMIVERMNGAEHEDAPQADDDARDRREQLDQRPDHGTHAARREQAQVDADPDAERHREQQRDHRRDDGAVEAESRPRRRSRSVRRRRPTGSRSNATRSRSRTSTSTPRRRRPACR